MAKLSLWIMAAGYVLVGVAHFSHTGDFVKIVPPYLPYPVTLVYISGFFEIGLALAALFKSTRRFACYGIIALLLAVLPANIYMLTSYQPGSSIAHWILVLRIPFQGVLMLWAYGNSRIRE
jgi:uncharacterized membrane protein